MDLNSILPCAPIDHIADQHYRSMPRGRGRSRSRGQESFPRRVSRSGQTQLSRGTSIDSLRRSARIAELVTKANERVDGSTMTDVARRSQITPSRSARHQRIPVVRQRRSENESSRSDAWTNHTRQSRQTLDSQQRASRQSSYSLTVLGHPPSQTYARVTFQAPLSVRVDVSQVDAHFFEYNTIWGAVSLNPVAANGALCPHVSGVLDGTVLVASVVPFQGPEVAANGASGTLSFPSLRILETGWYSIRVTLYRMADTGAETVQFVDTGPIAVSPISA